MIWIIFVLIICYFVWKISGISGMIPEKQKKEEYTFNGDREDNIGAEHALLAENEEEEGEAIFW